MQILFSLSTIVISDVNICFYITSGVFQFKDYIVGKLWQSRKLLLDIPLSNTTIKNHCIPKPFASKIMV